jgi:hypothetical protein
MVSVEIVPDSEDDDKFIQEKFEVLKGNLKPLTDKNKLKSFMKSHGWIFVTWVAFFLVGLYFGYVFMWHSCNNYIHDKYEFIPNNQQMVPNIDYGLKPGIVSNSVNKTINLIDDKVGLVKNQKGD